MNRRSFIQSLIASGALYSSGALPVLGARAQAATFPMAGQPFLASILLSGGPDFRHLLPPAFDSNTSSVGYGFWHAKASSHDLGQDTNSLQQRWQNDYFAVGDSQTEFGILKSCGWLKNMWDSGNVAIINNTLSTSARNHPLGVLITELGNRQAQANNFNVPGWGGRLADAAQRNVMSLTPSPRKFCFSATLDGSEGRSNGRLIDISDSRRISLYSGSTDDSVNAQRAVITRGVSSYYAARSDAFAANEQAARFASHEAKLRLFGSAVDDRLASVPLPDSIARLYEADMGALFNPSFGKQVRNLYDCFACSDLLNMGVAALEYTGWDSHRLQKATIEPRFADLFGEQQALDTLFSELPTEVSDNLVLVLGGEFGRQIHANGDGGTDHGEGSTMLVIGKPVSGGIYGDMFPGAELARLNDPSPQIIGLTGIERVYSEIANWFSSGSGAAVFPTAASAPLESGLDLSQLFK